YILLGGFGQEQVNEILGYGIAGRRFSSEQAVFTHIDHGFGCRFGRLPALHLIIVRVTNQFGITERCIPVLVVEITGSIEQHARLQRQSGSPGSPTYVVSRMAYGQEIRSLVELADNKIDRFRKGISGDLEIIFQLINLINDGNPSINGHQIKVVVGTKEMGFTGHTFLRGFTVYHTRAKGNFVHLRKEYVAIADVLVDIGPGTVAR